MEYEKVKKLSPEMKQIFDKLKAVILNDYGPKEANDVQIHRFLAARDFDFKQAENMLRKHIEWRKSAEPLFKNFSMNEIQAKYMRMVPIGFDIEGFPVMHIDMGNVDVKGLLKSVKLSDVLNGIMWQLLGFEKQLDEQSEKLGKIIDQWIIILSYENFQISQVLYKQNIDFFMQAFSLYEANFPERLKASFCVNASTAFTVFFNIIKTVISAHTLSKLRVFGQDGWREELLKLVKAEDLPMHLGGTKTHNGDPYCNLLKITGPVPKHYYFRSPERRLRGKKDVEEFILKRNEMFDITINVEHTESEIFWKFESERGNISFGLFYRKIDSPTIEEIIPSKSVNAHMEIEDGSHVCQKGGTYILRLDNTYSWLREKRLFCEIFVVKPDKEKLVITC